MVALSQVSSDQAKSCETVLPECGFFWRESIPREMPILAHGGEMVLPKHLSEGIAGMVKGGGSGSSSVNNFHVSALDSSSFQDFLYRNQTQFANQLRGMVRNRSVK